jgi:hypothetical protein
MILMKLRSVPVERTIDGNPFQLHVGIDEDGDPVHCFVCWPVTEKDAAMSEDEVVTALPPLSIPDRISVRIENVH